MPSPRTAMRFQLDCACRVAVGWLKRHLRSISVNIRAPMKRPAPNRVVRRPAAAPAVGSRHELRAAVRAVSCVAVGVTPGAHGSHREVEFQPTLLVELPTGSSSKWARHQVGGEQQVLRGCVLRVVAPRRNPYAPKTRPAPIATHAPPDAPTLVLGRVVEWRLDLRAKANKRALCALFQDSL